MLDWSSPKENIKVVSFNIEYSIHIDAAIQELQETPELRNADLLLLQEMDETGVKRIADSLQYNYLYYPASINSISKNFFGNAILSKWPLSDEKKIILPHLHPQHRAPRIAVAATVVIDQKRVRVYCVHSETMLMRGKKRREQHRFLCDEIVNHQDFDYVILGGDFNTFHKRDIRRSIPIFESIGLEWTNAEVPFTATALKGILKKRYDHIFVKGFTPLSAGRNDGSEASDHYPLWVDLKFR